MDADQSTSAPRTIGEHGGRIPVIGIGGSAGALDALTTLFEAMPADIGAAVVVIQHLAPNQQSNMAEIIARHTPMTAEPAADGVAAEANRIYVIPPGVQLEIRDGRLWLSRPEAVRGARMPVDLFFRSLAEDFGQKAVAIVLSGTGSDGTFGLRAIKEKGGLAIVQEPTEASYDGMPRSAIAAAAADLVLPVGDMPDAIARYYRQPYANGALNVPSERQRLEDALDPIVKLLTVKTAHDFASYKAGTLLRRTARRMALRHIRSPHVYLDLLNKDATEIELLVRDLLISVTSFFRDAESFRFLADSVLPDVLKSGDESQDFRVWTPGCSTGEEAYSLAIVLHEQMKKLGLGKKLLLFASDVHEDVLALARAGVYPGSIAADVSPQRLERYFVKDDHSYRVATEIRETVVFAEQNLLTDAPFSKLDLVSCRNVLIYLEPGVQGKLLDLFHFALQGKGILFLGPSETVAPRRERFRDVSNKHHIFACIGGPRRDVPFPIVPGDSVRTPSSRPPPPARPRPSTLLDSARALLVSSVAPASMVVNQRDEALCFFGPVERYLKIPPGEASHDALKMARDGLRLKLRTAIRRALADNRTVAADGASVERDGRAVAVAIEARPFEWESDKLVLVSLTDRPAPEGAPRTGDKGPETTEAERLERELDATRTELNDTIQQLETANEELRAANEEAMSMNEEFQSTNEELETSKEELQSVNEELTTLNAQLQQKAEQYRESADNLNNLLVSADIPTVFLDADLNIKLFTPAAKRLFSIIAGDIGRPLSDLARHFDDPDLLREARNVLTHLTPVAKEIASGDGSWYARRIRPYRTQDDRIDGVVLTFHDISDLVRARAEAERKRDALRRLAAIVESSEDAIILLDPQGVIVAWNPAAERIYGYAADAAQGRKIDLIARPDDREEPFRLLERVLRGNAVTDHRTRRIGKNGVEIPVSLTISPVRDESGRIVAAASVERDMSERERAEQALKESEARYRQQFEEMDTLYRTAPIGLALLDRDLRYIRINETLAEMGGRSPVDHIGRTLGEIVPGIAEALAPRLRRVIETGEVLRGFEVSGETAEAPGIVRHWRDDAYPVRAADGDIAAIGLIVREITEQKEAEASLQIAKDEAETANRIKSDFLAAASHDIRQPLQTLNFLQEVLERTVKDGEVARIVANLGGTIHGMIETLNTLLDIDQLESGGIEPDVQDVEFGECLRRLADEYMHQADFKGLDFRIVPTTAWIRTDRNLFTRVLQNIVSNAVKYTDAGRIVIGCRRRGSDLRIEVWDSGIGIPADELDTIFDKYRRLHAFQGHHGLGLGLAVVRHVTRLLDHTFDVRSVVGKGSVFAVTVPRAENPPPPNVEQRGGDAPGDRGSATILLIENEQPLLEFDGVSARPRGARRRLGRQRAEALRHAGEIAAAPELIVADFDQSGDLTGVELVKKLRATIGRDIPAVMISGMADRRMLERITEAGIAALHGRTRALPGDTFGFTVTLR